VTHSSGLAIIYLGKRGGGNRFTLNLIQDLIEDGIACKILVSDENQLLETYIERFPNRVLELTAFTPTLLNVFKPIKRFWAWQRIMKELSRSGVKTVVITMPHIFDNFAFIAAKKESINVVRIIHDYKKHPGDVWPNRISIIIRMLLSDHCIFLSSYVMRNTFGRRGKKKLASFPNERNSITAAYPLEGVTSRGDILIIGRLRKYKGLSNLRNLALAFKEYSATKFSVRGSGNIEISDVENVKLTSGWLSEEEFEKSIYDSRLVLLLHTEASQSGIIPIAHSLKKWVVAPRLAAFPEQIQDGENGFLYTPGDKDDLLQTLLKAEEISKSKFPTRIQKSDISNVLASIISEQVVNK